MSCNNYSNVNRPCYNVTFTGDGLRIQWKQFTILVGKKVHGIVLMNLLFYVMGRKVKLYHRAVADNGDFRFFTKHSFINDPSLVYGETAVTGW